MARLSLVRLPTIFSQPINPLIAGQPAMWRRFVRYQPFDASFDPEDLAEARRWRQDFNASAIPKGSTTYARSSGPGGQHVNKTETKAITTWSVTELHRILPKLMHPLLRSSKYYVKGKDSLSFQAQTKRDRTANAEENRGKLLQELQRMYSDTIPGDTSTEKRQKHAALKVIPRVKAEVEELPELQEAYEKRSRIRSGNLGCMGPNLSD